jgi:hypothetical protein
LRLQCGESLRPLLLDLACQLFARLLPLLFPVAEPLPVLGLQRLGLFLQSPCVAQCFVNIGTAPCDDVQHRFVEKALQDPDQDQEVDDLENKG